jgi:hypothetical protein
MKMMKLTALAVLIVVGAAMAQETEKKMAIKVMVSEDHDGEPTEMHWISDGAELDDLAVGGSRTLTGEAGEEITVTRTEEGMQFDVEGETVVVPSMGNHGEHMVFVSKGGDHDLDIEMLGGDHTMMRSHHPEGVTIISAEPLDDSVRESIRSVLISAGNDDEVTFIDGSANDGQVRVIKKRIEVQQ